MLTKKRVMAEAHEAPETVVAARAIEEAEEVVRNHGTATDYLLGAVRLSMGWIFFWAFIDKMFGLGYATAADKAWIAGGSPTSGFLNFGVKGPFAELYKGIAGMMVVDWMFMLGLLAIGVTLLLGVGVRLGAYIGVLILLLMYTAGFILPEHNPIIDEHIVYAIIMLTLAAAGAGRYLGLGKVWAKTDLVKRFPILE